MEDAPNIEPGRGRLVYDKARKTIVAERDIDRMMIDGQVWKLDKTASYLPCPICCGVEGCDHSYPERQRAAAHLK